MDKYYLHTFADCAHTIRIKNRMYKQGTILHCRKCNSVRVILTTSIEFRVKCNTCRYHRGFGIDRFKATGAFMRHIMKYPNHDLMLTQNDLLTRTVAPEPLPF